jgi:hypothetical protein
MSIDKSLQAELERLLLAATAKEPLKCTRVSTARLGSCQWCYWDVVRCQIKPAADGKKLKIHPLEAARKVYRSESKAFAEAEQRYPDRVFLGQGIARIDQLDLVRIIESAAAVNPGYIARHPELKQALEAIEAAKTLREAAV